MNKYQFCLLQPKILLSCWVSSTGLSHSSKAFENSKIYKIKRWMLTFTYSKRHTTTNNSQNTPPCFKHTDLTDPATFWSSSQSLLWWMTLVTLLRLTECLELFQNIYSDFCQVKTLWFALTLFTGSGTIQLLSVAQVCKVNVLNQLRTLSSYNSITKTFLKEDFQNCIRKWHEQWEKCVWGVVFWGEWRAMCLLL